MTKTAVTVQQANDLGKETVEQTANRLLTEAEEKAWNALAHGKFSLFGYWAAKVVQFRELLSKSREPSPFRGLVLAAITHVERKE